MKPRTFARRPSSIGSNQLSKSRPSASPARADVILLIMAWPPPALQRRNQGCEPRRLRHPIPTTSATSACVQPLVQSLAGTTVWPLASYKGPAQAGLFQAEPHHALHLA